MVQEIVSVKADTTGSFTAAEDSDDAKVSVVEEADVGTLKQPGY